MSVVVDIIRVFLGGSTGASGSAESARKALDASLSMLAVAIAVALSLASCSPDAMTDAPADAGHPSSSSASYPSESSRPYASTADSVSAAQADLLLDSVTEAPDSEASAPETPAPEASAFRLGDVAPYAGSASAEVNGGVPYFTADEYARGPFEEYSQLDQLGRCGVAFALVGPETMPVEERGSIGMVRPSGWHTVRYDGLVDGGYLYNRCHLIGYQLTGENANERNLITGTRTMNVEGMLPYENRVAAYVERTGNHVLYRSTPVFEGDDLVARGVLLEAESTEDSGAGVRFCAWCYNVEPGVEIDYATGESALAEGGEVAAGIAGAAVDDGIGYPDEAAFEGFEVEAGSDVADVRAYVLNANTHKFHHPDCPSVRDMAEHNKRTVEATRQEILDWGYDPCKRCNP